MRKSAGTMETLAAASPAVTFISACTIVILFISLNLEHTMNSSGNNDGASSGAIIENWCCC